MISSERMHKPASKLAMINVGDFITYTHEGETLRSRVQGFKLDLETHETRLLVGGEWHSTIVSLHCVTQRERLQGADSGIVTF